MSLRKRQGDYRNWLAQQKLRMLMRQPLRTDELSDEEVVASIRSVPQHYTGWTLVQQSAEGHVGSGTTVTAILTGTVSAGDQIFVCASNFANTSTVSGVADSLSGSNVYSRVTAKNSAVSDGRIEIWECPNVVVGGAGCTVTVTYSANSNGALCGCVEFSGGNTSGTQDTGSPYLAAGSSATPQPGAFSTTASGCLIITGFTSAVGTNITITDPGSYTRIYNDGNAASFCAGAAAFRILVGAASGENPTYTNTGGAQAWGDATVAMVPAGGGGGGTKTVWPYLDNEGTGGMSGLGMGSM